MNYPLNTKPSPLDSRDWVAETIFRTREEILLPDTLDLRPKLQPIRDQGNQGTCAAQTAACMKEWQEKIQVDLNEYLSPQFVYNLRENQDSEGMYGRNVMQILNQNGICQESKFIYGTMTKPSDEIQEEAKNFAIQSYARVDTIEGVKKALFKNGPCYVAYPVYNYGPHFWKPTTQGQEMLGGHAVTLVGYDENGFIVRNSWSTSWADNGYSIYPFEDFGAHWEIWSSIDADSNKPTPGPDPPTPQPPTPRPQPIKCKCNIM